MLSLWFVVTPLRGAKSHSFRARSMFLARKVGVMAVQGWWHFCSRLAFVPPALRAECGLECCGMPIGRSRLVAFLPTLRVCITNLAQMVGPPRPPAGHARRTHSRANRSCRPFTCQLPCLPAPLPFCHANGHSGTFGDTLSSFRAVAPALQFLKRLRKGAPGIRIRPKPERLKFLSYVTDD